MNARQIARLRNAANALASPILAAAADELEGLEPGAPPVEPPDPEPPETIRTSWKGSGPAIRVPIRYGEWVIVVEVDEGPIRGKKKDQLLMRTGPKDSQIYVRSTTGEPEGLDYQEGERDPWRHWDAAIDADGRFVLRKTLDAPSILWVGPDGTDREDGLDITGWVIDVVATRQP